MVLALSEVGLAEVLPWRPHPEVWLLAATLIGGYWWALHRLAPWYAPEGRPIVERWRVAAFGLGVLALWSVSDWPLHDIAEEALLSVHMVEHLVLALVVPPLFIVGVPPWLWQAVLKPLVRWLRLAVHPAVGLVLFNGVFVLTHWPPIIALQVDSELAHFVAHTVLVFSAFIMFWPVLSPIPEVPRLAPFMRMGYLFLQTILPTVPASFLTFSRTFLYADSYSTADRLWGLDPLADQQIAGLVMKLGGGVILWTMIAIVFFRWAAAEERNRTSTRAVAAVGSRGQGRSDI